MKKIPIVVLALIGLSLGGSAFVKKRPVVGELGYAAGTDLVIEGTKVERLPWSSAHPGAAKYVELLVDKINGRTLPVPRWITLANLDYFVMLYTLPNDVRFRFEGHEIAHILNPLPVGGPENSQWSSSGKDFEFEATKVLSPAGLELREKQTASLTPRTMVEDNSCRTLPTRGAFLRLSGASW
jgi:hypothetical protein